MGEPKYIVIQQYILSQIESGQWTEGMLIPTEAELSKRFGCSRITVTTALRELVKDGVIYRIQGKGTYVSKPASAQTVYDSDGLSQQVLPWSSLRTHGEHKVVSRSIETPDAEVAAILRLGEGERVLVFERIKYIEGSPTYFEVVYLPQELYSFVWEEHLEEQYIPELSQAHGIPIGKSYVSSAPVLCDAHTGGHLGIPEGLPILKFIIEMHDVQDRPVACILTFTRGIRNKVPLV